MAPSRQYPPRAFTIIDLDGNRLTFAQAIRYPTCIEAFAFTQIA